MKNHQEKLMVKGIYLDINFEVTEIDKPIHILSVNEIPSVNFVEEFIDDCEFACSNWLVIQERKAEEESDDSRGN